MLKLRSGFEFDFSNLYGEGKVTAEDIDGIKDRIAAAHAAVKHMRSSGEVRGHNEPVLFPQLPYIADGNLNSPKSIARLKAFGSDLRNKADVVLHFGIGGSYLGNKVLYVTHGGEFWNSRTAEERNGYPKLYFGGYSVDPRQTKELILQVRTEAKQKALAGRGIYHVTMVVVSKSGGTMDTMSTFMVTYEALLKMAPEIEVSVVAVTDPTEGEKATLLKRLAEKNGWPTFAVPNGVGGRFSVFSEVGLITAACIGMDIEAFLDGARAMDEACDTEDLWKNPAMLNAILKYLAATNHGREIEVFMPYADSLKPVAEWYIQLLAESLGKRHNRDGKNEFYGRTPIVAVGTTDMHAQTQQHQDGKRDKVVQFVRVKEWQDDPVIPNAFPDFNGLAQIAGVRMSQALDVALEANALALSGDERFNASISLPKINAYHLGELLYMLALSVAYEGELANVNAFDQPGVEAYKKIMTKRLAEIKSSVSL